MKELVYLLAAFLCLNACQGTSGYKITANIADMPDGLTVYLEDAGRKKLDSTLTSGCSFSFEGRLVEPLYAEISVKTPGERFSGRSFDLFLENSDIHVQGDWEKWSKIAISGSALQAQYEAFENQLTPLYRKLNREIGEQEYHAYTEPLHNGRFTAACIAPGIEIAKKRRVINRQIDELYTRFIEENPASIVTLKLLGDRLRNKSRFTMAEINELTSKLSPELKRTAAYKVLEKKIEAYRPTARGEKYLDFRVVDVNGKEGMFSDYVQPGKYNMLEVWASWCGYCRLEIPHLKVVRQKYGDRFNIIGVSSDKNEQEWREAMAKDKPNYLQLQAVRDNQGKDVNSLYGLNAIPYSLIIDGEGRIVTTEGAGTKLDLFLEELFGE